jgi:hypothetical protein
LVALKNLKEKKREENPEDVELIIQDGRHEFERGG